jgi:hypothetical protein
LTTLYVSTLVEHPKFDFDRQRRGGKWLWHFDKMEKFIVVAVCSKIVIKMPPYRPKIIATLYDLTNLA